MQKYQWLNRSICSKSKKYYFNYEKAKEINDGKQMKNLWIITAKRHVTKHPIEKPEELLERIILLGSKEGDTILDPFMGSGTTGVVAKKLGRKFIGIEIDDEFFNICEDRIKKVGVPIHSNIPLVSFFVIINFGYI